MPGIKAVKAALARNSCRLGSSTLEIDYFTTNFNQRAQSPKNSAHNGFNKGTGAPGD